MKTLKKLFFLLLSFITVFLILKLFVNTDLLIEQAQQKGEPQEESIQFAEDEPINEQLSVYP